VPGLSGRFGRPVDPPRARPPRHATAATPGGVM